ncbi:hypothetical protein M5689_001480 [Euphorbia peplus]|nr:hypothetical protein M5689_001480 [Euphorbia peplus]
MAEAKMVSQKQQHDEQDGGNIFSFLSKFPFFGRESATQSVVKEEPNTAVVTETPKPKPNIVSFPNSTQLVSNPLGVEVEESSGKTHNPLIIWQVYALGGFIIVKWVLARWKERNERAKKSAEDGNQSSDEHQSPADENDQQ